MFKFTIFYIFIFFCSNEHTNKTIRSQTYNSIIRSCEYHKLCELNISWTRTSIVLMHYPAPPDTAGGISPQSQSDPPLPVSHRKKQSIVGLYGKGAGSGVGAGFEAFFEHSQIDPPVPWSQRIRQSLESAPLGGSGGGAFKAGRVLHPQWLGAFSGSTTHHLEQGIGSLWLYFTWRLRADESGGA